DSMREFALRVATDKLSGLQSQLNSTYSAMNASAWSDCFAAMDRPLRILGITSRYTTFLQYSMRDWLSAFERLGPQTRLGTEQSDHEITGPVAFAEATADFQPDLVVCIDHFRKELGGLPANV